MTQFIILKKIIWQPIIHFCEVMKFKCFMYLICAYADHNQVLFFIFRQQKYYNC